MPNHDLQRLNAIAVWADLLTEVVTGMTRRPAGEIRGMPQVAAFVQGFLKRKGLESEAGLAMALQARMAAFNNLLRSGALKEWTRATGEEDVIVIQLSLLHAAALEPLVETPDGALTFEPDSFRKCVEGIEFLDAPSPGAKAKDRQLLH